MVEVVRTGLTPRRPPKGPHLKGADISSSTNNLYKIKWSFTGKMVKKLKTSFSYSWGLINSRTGPGSCCWNRRFRRLANKNGALKQLTRNQFVICKEMLFSIYDGSNQEISLREVASRQVGHVVIVVRIRCNYNK